MSLTVQRSSAGGLRKDIKYPSVLAFRKSQRDTNTELTASGSHFVAPARKNSSLSSGKVINTIALFTLLLFTGKTQNDTPEHKEYSPSSTLTSLASTQKFDSSLLSVSQENQRLTLSSKPFVQKYLDNGQTIVLIFPMDCYEANIVKAWDKTNKVETVSSMVERFGAIAGVNGGFFDLTSKSPIGIEIIDGEIVSWNSGKNWHWPIFYLDKNGTPHVYHSKEPLHLYFMVGNKKIPVHEVNSSRSDNETVMYNKYYSSDYTSNNLNGLDVVVENDRISRITKGNTKIPKGNGYVISFGSGTFHSFEKIYNSEIIQEVSLSSNLPSDIVNGLTLGSTLLENNVIDTLRDRPSSYIRQRHIRTGIGIDKDRGSLIVIISRKPRNLNEFALLFKRLGAEDAYNADGGSSTSVAFLKTNNKYFVSNGRKVINALIFNPKKIQTGKK